MANLRDLVPKARRDGHVVTRLGDGMWIALIDVFAPRGELAEMIGELHAANAKLGWPEHEKAFAWAYGGRRMRDRRYSFSTLAPVSILPLEPEDHADLMMGYLDGLVCVDGRRYEELCAERGLTAIVATGEESGSTFAETSATIDTGPEIRMVGAKSPAHIREQMQMELMTPESAIALSRPCSR